MATKEITKREPQYAGPELEPELVLDAEQEPRGDGKIVARLSLLWERRQFLFRWAAIGLVASTIIAFLNSFPLHINDSTDASRSSWTGDGVDAGSIGQERPRPGRLEQTCLG